ncbi:helix-turn-helix domain-containing protein [Vibrio europaeus]|uniref:AraC family transcriptional regulator n=1 Tax=Vibrio europaeus TaxID=300876 RepID=A0A178JD62_9VIBR|nr:helix-turn-helix domain-containing protein [Vibrio europaeus]MDC5703619.1 helix-turn-helix domain-containing protein [Vibrio europaeus]MDC5711226.1 helix-turn-helix domain-containing protein [Vibrio europaeus]MDC5714719.1 helix-turn-helix domain-containing protein [Vibrio europaeus]MDC5722381.1 helix-turn-helix domain-containing protein [Vibrio europaeus]MDC5727338.1 helix-turn-helix domain-containing protein [Vibrio europaeus]
MAANMSPKLFYPLPTLAQGKVFAAKQLFLADEGGIWLQDVRDQVLFFDGQHILPEKGSALDHEASQIAFLDNAFWSFFQNEIYRTVPNQEKELVFSLTPGTEILKIGSSKRFIWVSDERNFYTYQIDSGEFQTFSLMELYQYNQSSQIAINDAKFIFSKWVVATNAGVYLSEGSHFEHVSNSGKNYVEKLYFSEKRRELIIGSLNGALIFNINKPNEPIRTIAGSHVLSITETDQEYWIGTEKGLFVYTFLTGETQKFEQGIGAGNSLAGEKIYSLLNDNTGGIWVATDRGVRYFSLYSHKFTRYSNEAMSVVSRGEKLVELYLSKGRDGYWLLTNKGVFKLNLVKPSSRKLVFRGRVHDVEEHNGVLWLATDKGIVCVNADTGEVIDDDLPNFLKTNTVRFLEFDHGKMLWGASDTQLWSFDLVSHKLTQYGSEWMIDKYLPAQLTNMYVTSQDYVTLGTEHGMYIVRDGQISFVGESIPYGEVIDAVQPSESELWVASRYGLYRLDLFTNNVEPIDMVDGHVTPKCLIQNQDGVWLTSSTGLSRYTSQGSLTQHYGEPFGVISNEFLPGVCTFGSDSERTIFLGADSSLVKVNTQQLVVSRLPDTRVIFSQIKRNQKLFSLANTVQETPQIGYGESIFFQFGFLPSASNINLEYRLNQSSDWQALDGSTLTIEHLMPGEYSLEVRAVRNGRVKGNSNSYQFLVTEPWFLSHIAIVTYVLAVLVVIAVIVYWRSRLMAKSNRLLKAQVALKTNQLRHQSRVLLGNNNQLRKQLEVRWLIYSQSVNELKERLTITTSNSLTHEQLIGYMQQELETLINVRSTNGQALPVFNLTMIVNSVISSWKDELAKVGVNVELESDQELFIGLNDFNLDELFNLLFDGILRRCYRNQTVVIQLVQKEGMVVFSMLDQGDAFDSNSGSVTSSDNLHKLVTQSGGEMSLFSSEDRNLLEISWQESVSFENSPIVMPADEECAELVHDDPWLSKVIQLVDDHYTDPEFSTSSAAKMLYVSERSLQRRLKSSIEKTFTEYLTEVRLDNACRRLLAGEKVSDVAFECGFNDPSYFSQRFKHRFGMSPTQFVEQQSRY